jgi:hypothetical protein
MKLRINKIPLIISILLTLILLILLIEPMPQDINYHGFSDISALFSIPNGLNVLSNIPFLLVGVFGYCKASTISSENPLKTAYLIFYLGVLLVSIGSGYYHLSPNNSSLVWDRLPMTIAFMALFTFVIGEFIDKSIVNYMLWPFILLGLSSIAYWQYTESIGAGDLRFYILVQFVPLLAIPIIISLFEGVRGNKISYWQLIICYILAKLFELYDKEVHQLLGLISGHSLKHLFAAFGIYLFYRSHNIKS